MVGSPLAAVEVGQDSNLERYPNYTERKCYQLHWHVWCGITNGRLKDSALL